MAKRGNIWTDVEDFLDTSIEDFKRQTDGVQKFDGARKEWSRDLCYREMDVPIETLLSEEYYLGKFKIWPSVREELETIWHMRCNYDAILLRRLSNGEQEILKRDSLYALSYEHARRKMQEKYPRLSEESTHVDVRRNHNMHTLVLECPKGTGKNFESSLIIWLLVREFLVHDREEFFLPYELDLTTVISINLMNRSEDQAKRVTFKEVLPKFNVPFFTDYFPPQVDLADMEDKRQYPRELRFPMNVVLFPGSGSAATGLGYCIAAAIMDECNFLEKTESGKRSIMGADGYDAAVEAYGDLYQRQESRFGAVRNGRMSLAGMTVCISSTRTKNDFTQKMKRRAENDPGIYYKSEYFWERKPLDLSGETFEFDLSNKKIGNLPGAEETYAAMTAIPDGLIADED
jgi:hypothetical protein